MGNVEQISLFVNDDSISSIDELFRRSRLLRSSKKFYDLLNFIKKLRNYSPFNNMLVYLQNPNVTYYATASHWWKAFQRNVKSDARAMVILAPMTPVLFVYDLADTEGPPLPQYLINPFETEGKISPKVLAHTISNCKRDQIEIKKTEKSFLNAGCAVRCFFRDEEARRQMRSKVFIEINNQLDDSATYATICHEIAHIYLGHLGTDKEEWWPERTYLTKHQMELEAEAASFLVCSRAGLETKSAEYLSMYLQNEDDLKYISLDWIMKTAGFIEKMGKQKLADRKSKS